jgi:hypothetical protein
MHSRRDMLRDFDQKVERIVNLEITGYSGHQGRVAGQRATYSTRRCMPV